MFEMQKKRIYASSKALSPEIPYMHQDTKASTLQKSTVFS